MKISRLLNKKSLLFVFVYLILSISVFAEDKPIDIWNLDKSDSDTISENNSPIEKVKTDNQKSVYDLQLNKKKETIKLDTIL